ncbi:hypothetical protein C0J52_13311 [Blattella germanica]|nr:hypothetical protein C0J52_13311 [Blattella germanica]
MSGTWDMWQNFAYHDLPLKTTDEYFSLAWHNMRRVSGEKKYICKGCGRGYMWSSALKRHMNLECNNKEPKYQCPYCPLKTRQFCSLKRHLKNKHQT